MSQPVVIVLVGVPCSGKTGLRRELVRELGDVLVYSTDDVLDRYSHEMGIPLNSLAEDAEFSKRARRENEEGLEDAIAAGRNVIRDQMNGRPDLRRGFLSRFPSSYRKLAVAWEPPRSPSEEEELFRRMHERGTMILRRDDLFRFIDHFEPPTTSEGFDEILWRSSFPQDAAATSDNGARP